MDPIAILRVVWPTYASADPLYFVVSFPGLKQARVCAYIVVQLLRDNAVLGLQQMQLCVDFHACNVTQRWVDTSSAWWLGMPGHLWKCGCWYVLLAKPAHCALVWLTGSCVHRMQQGPNE